MAARPGHGGGVGRGDRLGKGGGAGEGGAEAVWSCSVGEVSVGVCLGE